jgi:triosephosphate isomerase
MNTTMAEAVELATAARDAYGLISGAQMILCPPFVYLAAVHQVVAGTRVSVGAQNMYFEASGAFTGEIAPGMLNGICEYVILGHSERRQIFGETDQLTNRKVHAALEHGLRPILCVGETLEHREAGRAQEVVRDQVRSGLDGVVDITRLAVAYEPVWAIGTGRAATPEIVTEIMGSAILETLTSAYGSGGRNVTLLYGGSVNPDNAAGFAAQSCIYGALVGEASLDAQQFLEIARWFHVAKAVQ